MNQAEQEVEMCACVFMCREMEQGRDVGTIIECDFVWETDRLTGGGGGGDCVLPFTLGKDAAYIN